VGSGQWWARKIKALGHELVLLHAKSIRPFVKTNKTATVGRAIWTPVQQPTQPRPGVAYGYKVLRSTKPGAVHFASMPQSFSRSAISSATISLPRRSRCAESE
jgi:hypothetical protein